MTAIEYMTKQLEKAKRSLKAAINRKAPQQDIDNLKAKIGYYEEAVRALVCCSALPDKDGEQNGV